MSSSETARRHSRDDVARTALRLLDDVGLPDLTMRRLAAALDVQPSALYHHFPNKQTMLAEIADRIVTARPAAAALGDWPDDVYAAAGALRDDLLAYRDGAEVVASTLSMGLGADAAGRRLADAIAGGGFNESTVARASTALLHFVLGHTSHEQQRLQFDSLGVVVDGPAATDASAEAFAFGVELLIDGLRTRVAAASLDP
jgi:AcrR family transcriptional regulator